MARKRQKPPRWIDAAPCLPDKTYPGYDRRAFRACVIDRAVDTKKRPKGKPFAVLTMGVPGTGKTTTIAPLLKGKSFVCSCPDDVKDQIPEYVLGVKERAKNAGSVVQVESVKIASDIADRAVKERKNLLIDGTGAILSRYKSVIKKLKKAGYKVTVVGVHAPFPVVKKRLIGRAEVTGRYLPTKVAAWYDTQVPCNFLPVAKLADEFKLYDVTQKKPRAILTKSRGVLKVNDRAELDRITKKCRR